MMDNKVKPIEIALEPGKTYLWCQCGFSKNQPFCDNSHVVTKIKPKAFSVLTARKAWLCVCKKTKNHPYCDGSHLKE
jgi:CDGSH iron-sulfur domain-containing protein 3